MQRQSGSLLQVHDGQVVISLLVGLLRQHHLQTALQFTRDDCAHLDWNDGLATSVQLPDLIPISASRVAIQTENVKSNIGDVELILQPTPSEME